MLVPIYNWDTISIEDGTGVFEYPFKVDSDSDVNSVLTKVYNYINDTEENNSEDVLNVNLTDREIDPRNIQTHDIDIIYTLNGSAIVCVIGAFADNYSLCIIFWGNNPKVVKELSDLLSNVEIDDNLSKPKIRRYAEKLAKSINGILKSEDKVVKNKNTGIDIYDVSDQFEELINNGKMTWSKGTVDDIPNAGRYVLEMLEGINWLIGDIKVDDCIVLKLDDEYIQYVDIFNNGQHMWCTDNHHAGVKPRDAITRFLTIKEKDKNKRKNIRNIANKLWPEGMQCNLIGSILIECNGIINEIPTGTKIIIKKT